MRKLLVTFPCEVCHETMTFKGPADLVNSHAQNHKCPHCLSEQPSMVATHDEVAAAKSEPHACAHGGKI